MSVFRIHRPRKQAEHWKHINLAGLVGVHPLRGPNANEFGVNNVTLNSHSLKEHLPEVSEIIIDESLKFKVLRTGDGYNGWIFYIILN